MNKSTTAAFATLTLGAALCAVLSGCTGIPAPTAHATATSHPTASAATTTAPKPTTAPTTAPAPMTAAVQAPSSAPAVAAPSPAATTASTPGCVPLFGQAGTLAAATYISNSCIMDGTTVNLTGPATTPDGRFIAYPNGVTVTLAEVQKMPQSYGSAVNTGVYLEPSYTLVRVDLTVTNTGGTAADLTALETQTAAFGMFYGNGISSPSNPGIIDAANTITLVHQDTPPTVVVPGSRADVYESFSVPTADLSSMSVVVDPNPSVGYTPYRMTDLDAVMVPFH